MDSISFYAHPEILSTISFHIDNYKDASIHISINCVRTKKFIRVVIGNKFCLMNDKKLTPEACDDLHFAIFEFNLQDKEYLCLLAMPRKSILRKEAKEHIGIQQRIKHKFG